MMKMHWISAVSGASLAALLCSCATSSVKDSWKEPSFTKLPVKKTAIVAVLEEGNMARQAFEGQLLAAMKRRNADGLITHDLGRLAEIKADLPGAGAKIRAAGADSVLLLRKADMQTQSRDVRESNERYAPMVTGFSPDFGSPYYRWEGYYEMAFMDMSVVRTQVKQIYYLEYALFDLESKRLVWTGRTKSSLNYDADRLGELYTLVEKVASAMKRDGVIR
jgi:hypothetical protein